jgi:hypothetical protein
MKTDVENTQARAAILPVFAATPPRHLAQMPMQRVIYWTPRAAAVAMFRGMAKGMGPQRVLRPAAVPVKNNNDE